MYHIAIKINVAPILKLHSIPAVANFLAHNNISQICYCGQISSLSAAVNCSFPDNLTPLGVTFILLAMVPCLWTMQLDFLLRVQISSDLSSEHTSGLLIFSIDSALGKEEAPSSSVLTSRLEQLCISYVILSSLEQAAKVNQYLAKSGRKAVSQTSITYTWQPAVFVLLTVEFKSSVVI